MGNRLCHISQEDEDQKGVISQIVVVNSVQPWNNKEYNWSHNSSLSVSLWSSDLIVMPYLIQCLSLQKILRVKIFTSHTHFSITYDYFNSKIFCEKSTVQWHLKTLLFSWWYVLPVAYMLNLLNHYLNCTVILNV